MLIIPGRSFNRHDIENSIKDYLQTLPDKEVWKDYFEDSVGKTLIDLLSAITELLIFKADSRLREQYFYTALTASSVYLLSDTFGHSVNRKSAASGKVTLNFSSPLASELIIPEGTRVDSSSPLVTTETVTVPVGSSSIELDVLQGEFKYILITSSSGDFYYLDDYVEKITAQGIEYERIVIEKGFKIDNSTINDTLKIWECSSTVDNELSVNNLINWSTMVPNLNSETVLLRTYYKGGVYLVFGDGTYGKRLNAGDKILIRYLETEGLSAFIPAGTSIEDLIFDIIGGSIVVSGTVSSAITGGSDEDSVDKLKLFVTSWFAAQFRAVTLSDWYSMLMSYPGVENVQVRKKDIYLAAETEYLRLSNKISSNQPITLPELQDLMELFINSCCTVEIVCLTQGMKEEDTNDWENPQDYWNVQRTNYLIEYIDNYKMISPSVEVVDPIYKELSISFTISINLGENKEYIINKVKEKTKSFCYKMGITFYPNAVTKEILGISSGIKRVDINEITINSVEVDEYSSITLNWGEYFRIQNENVLVNFAE